MCKSIGLANRSVGCPDLAGNWPTNLFNSMHCCGQFRSGVLSLRVAVARVKAVNRCAILHIGPAVAFLSHLRAI